MIALENPKRENLIGQTGSGVDLVWLLTEADTETRILVQICYLGAVQKIPVGTWASVTGKKRHPIKSKPALTVSNWRLMHWGHSGVPRTSYTSELSNCTSTAITHCLKLSAVSGTW